MKKDEYDPDLDCERRKLDDHVSNACLECRGETGDYQQMFCSQECETRYYDAHAVYVEEKGLDKTPEEAAAKCMRLADEILLDIRQINENLEASRKNMELAIKMIQMGILP